MLIAAFAVVVLFTVTGILVPALVVGKPREAVTSDVAVTAVVISTVIMSAMTYIAARNGGTLAISFTTAFNVELFFRLMSLISQIGRKPGRPTSARRAAVNTAVGFAELAGVLYLLTQAV